MYHDNSRMEMEIMVVLVVIIVVILLYFIVTYNKLTKLNNMVNESFATMDVYLKKRWDLIPNLVEIVKGYAKHEESTFEEISKLRSGNYEELSREEKIKTNEQINKNIERIVALAESYPELKANENFLNLQNKLNEIEEKIRFARQFYNDSVLTYKNKIEMFPSNIVAGMFNFKPEAFFEATEEERQNVQVKF